MTTRLARLSICTMMVAFALSVVAGCAAYTGPKTGSSAQPPANPPRPEPVAAVLYRHEPKSEDPQENTDNIVAAYAKCGRPTMGIVFFTADNSIVIGQRLIPLLEARTSSNVSVRSRSEKDGAANASIQEERVQTLGVPSGYRAEDAKLISWSDIQQGAFDALRACGIRVIDPETISLTGLNGLVQRTRQDVSLHTAELETVRNASGCQTLLVLQEVWQGGHRYLQGRAWDMKDGALLAAQRSRFWTDSGSSSAAILDKAKARRFTLDLLAQAAQFWQAQ